MNRRSLLVLFAGLAMILAACSPSGGGQSINDTSFTAPAIAPILTGLSATSADQYTSWFRGEPGAKNPFTSSADITGQTGAATGTAVMLDARCGLEYAYDRNADQANWAAGGDGLKIPAVNSNNTEGLQTSGQVLLWLQGYSLSTRSSAACTDSAKRTRGFIPIRLDLSSKRWHIDGFAAPGATVTISISSAWQLADQKDATHLADGYERTAIEVPWRLARFSITDANAPRVAKFSLIQGDSSIGPVIHWFRASDLAPSYTHQVTTAPTSGTTCLPALAFWGKTVYSDGGDDAKSYCPDAASTGILGKTDFSGNDTLWMDPGANQTLDEGSDSGVIKLTDKEKPTGNALSTGQWKTIEKALLALAINTTYAPTNDAKILANRTNAIGQIAAATACDSTSAALSTCGALMALDAFPADLIDPATKLPFSDVFGVVATHGSSAWGGLTDVFTKYSAIQAWASFVGTNPAVSPVDVSTATLSPSLATTELKTDIDIGTFYAENSFLFKPATGTIRVMASRPTIRLSSSRVATARSPRALTRACRTTRAP